MPHFNQLKRVLTSWQIRQGWCVAHHHQLVARFTNGPWLPPFTQQIRWMDGKSERALLFVLPPARVSQLPSSSYMCSIHVGRAWLRCRRRVYYVSHAVPRQTSGGEATSAGSRCKRDGMRMCAPAFRISRIVRNGFMRQPSRGRLLLAGGHTLPQPAKSWERRVSRVTSLDHEVSSKQAVWHLDLTRPLTACKPRVWLFWVWKCLVLEFKFIFLNGNFKKFKEVLSCS